MSNNVTLNPGSGGSIIQTIDNSSSVAGAQTPVTVLSDPTGTLFATVLPPSTSPDSSNTAIVVAISPNCVANVSASSLPLPIGASTSANQPKLNSDGGSLSHITNWPASTNAIQSGTWNIGTISSALPAGTNTIGSVNAINSPLPTGTNTIGVIGIDQHNNSVSNAVYVNNLPSTQNVSVVAALPSGTNDIGSIIVSSGSLTQRSTASTPTAASTLSITTGGSAQVLFAANSNGFNFHIYNPRSATESLFISLSQSTYAASWIEILPGGYYNPDIRTNTAVYIYSTTTGHSFTAEEW